MKPGKTNVTVMEAQPLPPGSPPLAQRPPAKKLRPQPLRDVPYPEGSDEAKAAAVAALTKQGFVVRSASFTPDGIMVYVNKGKREARAPRSAKRRGG